MFLWNYSTTLQVYYEDIPCWRSTSRDAAQQLDSASFFSWRVVNSCLKLLSKHQQWMHSRTVWASTGRIWDWASTAEWLHSPSSPSTSTIPRTDISISRSTAITDLFITRVVSSSWASCHIMCLDLVVPLRSGINCPCVLVSTVQQIRYDTIR